MSFVQFLKGKVQLYLSLIWTLLDAPCVPNCEKLAMEG